MGLTRTSLLWILWGCLISLNFSCGCHNATEATATKALQERVAHPRGRHRLQLLFPLLLRISTRLATLVPTALMGLLGIILFVVFSKKALIVSLFALFLSLSEKYRAKNDDIYIHKVNYYSDYNDEEHIHYYHRGPPRYNKHYNGNNRPNRQWKKYYKKTIPSLPHIPNPIPLNVVNTDEVKPFKPLLGFQKKTDLTRIKETAALLPSASAK